MRTQDVDNGGLRRISGTVNSTGAIISGTGFLVTKVGTGSYFLTFPGSRYIRNVTLTTAGTNAFIAQGITNPAQCNVNTWNNANTAVDAGFGFTAELMPTWP